MRQGKVERGPFSKLAFCPDSSTVGLNQVLHDGEAEARSPQFLRPPFINSIEAFKDSGKIFLWDSDSIVLHRKFNLL